MDLSNDLKKLMEEHPILSTIVLTIFIWYGSYHLGNGVGEFIANLKNN